MKKIFAMLILILLMSSVTYGAETEDIYVRKDVFEARMDRMEALIEKAIMEMKAENEKFRSEMRSENEKFRNEIRGEISVFKDEIGTKLQNVLDEINNLKTEIRVLEIRVSELDHRISIIETIVYWIFAIVSVMLASLALIPIVREFRNPQVTLEDVKQVAKQLIEENNARLQAQ